jgi:hypothetical protein
MMQFPTLTPELCAELARDVLFDKPNHNVNKTFKWIHIEIPQLDPRAARVRIGRMCIATI